MTSSGTHSFSPEVAELVDEAVERCRIDPAAIGGRFIRSARRSLNYMFSAWQGEGTLPWTVGEQTFSPVQGDTTVALSAGSFEILMGGVRDSTGVQTPLDIIGMRDYFDIPDKTIQGRPDRLWPEFLATAATGYFWQAMGPTLYTLVLKVMRRIEDAGAASNTLQMPPSWFDAAADELAARLAVKFNPAIIVEKETFARNSLAVARRATRDTGDTRMVISRRRYR